MTIQNHIEHTLLKPEATNEAITVLCEEAKEAGLFAVCVNPWYVGVAKEALKNSAVKVVTVVGFPLGATFARIKALEAELAIKEGADEVDMVMNIGALKNGAYATVVDDINKVVKSSDKHPVKVIIETCLLTDEEKIQAVKLIAQGGAQFVKTSTGFNKAGATIEDVKLLRKEADKYGLGVKAAGGIRDAATAKAMLTAGADRIGTSAGKAIVEACHD